MKRNIDMDEISDGKRYGLNEMATDYDWFHNNSVWYDKKTNSITLSGRHQDAVINIDFICHTYLTRLSNDTFVWNENILLNVIFFIF